MYSNYSVYSHMKKHKPVIIVVITGDTRLYAKYECNHNKPDAFDL